MQNRLNTARTRIVKTTAALTLSAAAVGIVTISPAGAAAGDPSQWGRARAEAVRAEASGAGDPSQWLTRKVNEYEGQHRKVNEYEGQHRKVNEYEGQHRKVNEYEHDGKN
jgi:hypothetical protein